MQTLFKIFNLIVCVLFLFTSCRKDVQIDDTDIGCEGGRMTSCYTEPVGSLIHTCVQIGDSTYYFDGIEGSYCYISMLNKNAFYFSLTNSLNYLQNPVRVSILTEVMNPEIFFQKGIQEIDTLYIHNDPWIIGGSMYSQYYAIHAIFTWDTVFYENSIFKGKGFIETIDTLYTDYQDTYRCPNTYYPPQKIAFEFK